MQQPNMYAYENKLSIQSLLYLIKLYDFHRYYRCIFIILKNEIKKHGKIS